MSTTPEAISPAEPALAEREASQLLQRICVRRPYLALSRLRSPEPGAVVAEVTPEQPLGAEAGPIAAAEAGRHLAILGSLALASRCDDDDKRYYLACAAHIDRVCSALPQPKGTLIAEARAGHSFDGTDGATARTALRTHDGITTHLLTVEYRVLAAPVFERIFRDKRKLTAVEERNAHADPVLLDMKALDTAHARASTRFSTQQCAGHFDGYPAVPAARLMQGLCTLAGRLLQHRAGQPAMRYAVLRGDVRARRLAFAGDELWLSADHVRDRGAEVAICCRATLGEGAIVGELDLWLAPEDA